MFVPPVNILFDKNGTEHLQPRPSRRRMHTHTHTPSRTNHSRRAAHARCFNTSRDHTLTANAASHSSHRAQRTHSQEKVMVSQHTAAQTHTDATPARSTAEKCKFLLNQQQRRPQSQRGASLELLHRLICSLITQTHPDYV